MDSKKANLNEPLVTWLKEPTLWPEGVNDNGILTSTESSSSQSKLLKDEFPQLLCLEHVYHAIKCVEALAMVSDRINVCYKLSDARSVTGSAMSFSYIVCNGVIVLNIYCIMHS